MGRPRLLRMVLFEECVSTCLFTSAAAKLFANAAPRSLDALDGTRHTCETVGYSNIFAIVLT